MQRARDPKDRAVTEAVVQQRLEQHRHAGLARGHEAHRNQAQHDDTHQRADVRP